MKNTGGITAPAGFVASGIHCGIKSSGSLDLALVATSDALPKSAAAVFTSNSVQAAPVVVSKDNLRKSNGLAAAVLINSGNANALTGTKGIADALRMAELAASSLGIKTHHVLVCSTGLIGIPLPIDRLEVGIPEVVAERSSSPYDAQKAAQAIMTTDTRSKQVVLDGDGFLVAAMAKGAAMLAPNLVSDTPPSATMLAILTTDATAQPDVLNMALVEAVADSFNSLNIDGCTSTNDTVVLLSSGKKRKVSYDELVPILSLACYELSEQMAKDAEGATKLVKIRVQGALDKAQAKTAARQVATSLLVKCSLNGGDPYWGRIVSELGVALPTLDLAKLAVSYGDIVVFAQGNPFPHDEVALNAYMNGDTIVITCELGMGSAQAEMLSCDLGKGYIDENRTTS
ncbi:MAG: bifunctional glutamate N-acetyltransferase/amino-acid acetyltransferase ArgJ [Actinobacteria bacterium]|nr:bifunctional glutamate N-acetyltransferase/amino-acid acetyltransferase ArgJ [Actinomycetota bacterium]MCL6104091.1 bifunctional glutamate N-acetyltransferase/amino-acid acetyltransferase ArgJ [Actinomycetota bacterium]